MPAATGLGVGSPAGRVGGRLRIAPALTLITGMAPLETVGACAVSVGARAATNAPL